MSDFPKGLVDFLRVSGMGGRLSSTAADTEWNCAQSTSPRKQSGARQETEQMPGIQPG